MQRLCFEGILLQVGTMIGLVAQDPSIWLVPLLLAGISACAVTIIVAQLWNHCRRPFAGRAEKWEGEQSRRREEANLAAFWSSPIGKEVGRNPLFANDSVRIVPKVEGKAPDVVDVGLVTYELDEHYVAHIQIATKVRWQDRIVKIATQMANRRLIPGRLWRWIAERLGYVRGDDAVFD